MGEPSGPDGNLIQSNVELEDLTLFNILASTDKTPDSDDVFEIAEELARAAIEAYE